jgi:ATP-dependent DNA ligase
MHGKLLEKSKSRATRPQAESSCGDAARWMVKPAWAAGERGERANQWTRDGKLRQPVFLGLREDKNPREIKRE